MTFQSFIRQIVAISAILDMQGQPRTIEDIIMWDCEWHHKWTEAMKGKYDA